MQTVFSHHTTMHPTVKFALQERILAASVQDEAFQLHLKALVMLTSQAGWLP